MDKDLVGWAVLLCALATIYAAWQGMRRLYLFAFRGTPLGIKRQQVAAFLAKASAWIIFCTLVTRLATRTWADAFVWGSIWAWLIVVGSYYFPYHND